MTGTKTRIKMNIEIDRQSNRKSELTNVCSTRQESLMKQTKWKTITNEQWRQKTTLVSSANHDRGNLHKGQKELWGDLIAIVDFFT